MSTVMTADRMHAIEDHVTDAKALISALLYAASVSDTFEDGPGCPPASQFREAGLARLTERIYDELDAIMALVFPDFKEKTDK